MSQDESNLTPASMNWPGIAGKHVLVLGGASGMGEAAVRAYAILGASVSIADVQLDKANVIAQELTSSGQQASAYHVDASSRSSIVEGLGKAVEDSGPVEILLYTAGMSRFFAAEEVEPEFWDKALAINLSGAWHAAQTVMPAMMQSKHGKIVFIGSAAGISAIPKGLPYSSAKHGLIGLTRNLATDLGPYQINVNCICPSTIDTPMLREATKPTFRDQIRDRIPMGRLGTLDDTTNAILFLTSSLSSWITGVTLPVDGGLTNCLRAHHYE